jgi:RNA polymerase sigma-70 factor (ECF subfamily)
MNTYSFRKDLLAVQEELLRFAYKLTADREEANDLLQETSLKALDNEDKFEPDTNFRGWMYTIMRNIFINNYRKIVREQTFVDQTDNQYHLSMPQDSGFASTEGAYDLKEMHRIVNSLPRDYKVPFFHACLRLQVSRNSRTSGLAARNREKPDLLHPPEITGGIERFRLIISDRLRIVSVNMILNISFGVKIRGLFLTICQNNPLYLYMLS